MFVSNKVCDEGRLADEYPWAEEYEATRSGFWLYAKTKEEKAKGKTEAHAPRPNDIRDGSTGVVSLPVAGRKIYLGDRLG